MYRIEEDFPELRSEDRDSNILLQTIRVPKKLLSLTNRLPKPNYEISEDDKRSGHTTLESYFPDIKQQKHLKCESNIEKKLSHVNISNVNKEKKSIKEKILDRIPSKSKQEEISIAESGENNHSKSNNSKYDYDPDFENSNELKVNESDKIKNKQIIKHKSPSPILLSEKQDIIKALRSKETKCKRDANINENTGSNLSNKNNIQDKNDSQAPSLNQVLNRKNYHSKPLYSQLISNIYSGDPQQLSLVARRLRSIRRPKPLIKRNNNTQIPPSHNINRSLQHAEENEKKEKVNQSIPLKHKLEPLKLLNCNKDLENVELKLPLLLPNIVNEN